MHVFLLIYTRSDLILMYFSLLAVIWGAILAQVTEFKVERGAPLVIGRQHQAKEFEKLLSKARNPSKSSFSFFFILFFFVFDTFRGASSRVSQAAACMSFISRAHVQLEVQNDALLAINISNNPVYVVGSSTLHLISSGGG